MKRFILIFCLLVGAGFAADDPSVFAIGEWSKPVSTGDENGIRGRLMINQTPAHSFGIKGLIDTAVYLELQEFSSSSRMVRVHCEMKGGGKRPDMAGTHFRLLDGDGNPVAPQGTAYSGGGVAGSRWINLFPSCSYRMRMNMSQAGQLQGGKLFMLLSVDESWKVDLTSTNDYFLSATFRAFAPTNKYGLVDPTNRWVWYGELQLPAVKLPHLEKARIQQVSGGNGVHPPN